ncbi:hypothetical protein [Caudoviricetes sp.]|nr:hypothetical protein [Caudoviricetes sp.]UOF80996.1 hypothetical protein [Caudoviricetes sp.]UOF81392.1 hypothetical protein [Caudoviricetes sp.]
MNTTQLADKIVKFIRHYGPLSDEATDEQLKKMIIWYLYNDRILLIYDNEFSRKNIVAVVTYHQIVSAKEAVSKRWPVEDKDGKILYVRHVVVHPLYQSAFFLRGLITYAVKVFPGIEYLYFERGLQESKAHVLSVKHYFKETIHG